MDVYQIMMLLAQFGRFIYDIIKDTREQKNNRPPTRKG